MGGLATARGTSNSNARGSASARAARRAYLLRTYAADVLLDGEPACRCWRCGALLTEATMTVDRIHAGADGGSYRRENIRPACAPCNIWAGHRTQAKKRAMKGKAT